MPTVIRHDQRIAIERHFISPFRHAMMLDAFIFDATPLLLPLSCQLITPFLRHYFAIIISFHYYCHYCHL
jgi:hypothetical protein